MKIVKMKRGDVFARNMVVKNSLLTFKAFYDHLILPTKFNAMRKLFAVIAVATAFASCSKDVIKGTGSVVTSKRTVSDFSGVDVAGANNVFISYAPEITVTLKGYSNLVSHYQAEVKEGKLYLHYDNDVNVKNDNMQVYITMPSFNALSLSGSCSINATGSFDNTDKLSVFTSGDGNINIGDISTNMYSINSSGNSNISTVGVKAKTSDIEISGSSEVSLSVSDKLDVKISGDGKVYYQGEPATINTDISGSGKIIKL
jgi:hypothetical protein